MDIRKLALETCPSRFSRRNKKRFLSALDEIFEEEGYAGKDIDKRRLFLTRDRMYAFEKTAKLYVVVPYDTPERLFWHKTKHYPLDGNRSLNSNMVATYVPAVIFYVLILLFITFVVPLFEDPLVQGFINLVVFICTLLLIVLLIKGVSNRHNHNRNSAAVIAAVEFMQSLNKDQKRRVGFVFTDRNRRRCEGAAILMKYFQEQKKNPDIAELVRGKTGRVYGALMSLLTTMKGIPLAYNKDMQEDKEVAFDALETVQNCLELFTGMLSTMKFKKERMAASAMNGFTNATDAADYLVNKGVPFRDAHGIIGRLVLYCIEKNTSIDALSLEELQGICDKFGPDIYDAVSLKTCVEKRLTIGAPGKAAMEQVIALHKKYLAED